MQSQPLGQPKHKRPGKVNTETFLSLEISSCRFYRGLLWGDHTSMSANAAHFCSVLPRRRSSCSHSCSLSQLHRRSCHSQRPVGSANRVLKGTRACISASATSANIETVSTPHSGYHYSGAKRRFFEGWYFKVSLAQNLFVSVAHNSMQAVQLQKMNLQQLPM